MYIHTSAFDTEDTRSVNELWTRRIDWYGPSVVELHWEAFSSPPYGNPLHLRYGTCGALELQAAKEG